MPKFNLDRIRQISGEINLALSKLEKISKFSEQDFLNSAEKIDSVKYNLLVAIEGAIDICNHIAAKAGGRAPCDYGDCFVVLEELGVLPKELTEKLKNMARFRNLLVHLYWQVDNHRVYEIIIEDIADIKEYLGKIGKVINPA